MNAPIDPKDITPRKAKILIVDDTEANLIALKRLLKKAEAEIICANSGNEALKLTLDHHFALILLDVNMPGLDGYEVANLLRGEERSSVTPIIFLTATYNDNHHQLMGYESGAIDYLQKPINEKMLLTKVSIFLEIWEKSQSLSVMVELLEEANKNISKEVDLRRQSEAACQQLANTVFAAASEGIVVLNPTGQVVAVNAAFSRISHFTSDELVNQHIKMLDAHRHTQDYFDAIVEQLNASGSWRGEVWSQRKNGEQYLIWLSASTIRNEDGTVAQYVAIITDITNRKAEEEKLWWQANFDALTGLPNRALFIERLTCATGKVKQENSGSIALMFIDIDRFKRVNDSLGHAVGDQLLQDIAQRLSKIVSGDDTVSRLSGDEFVILLHNVAASEAIPVANQIIDTISQPFQLDDKEITVGASIGISLCPQDAGDASTLLRHADMAMYVAKEAGRNHFSFFTKEMDEKMQSILRLSNDLRHAIEYDELQVHYQPIIDTESLNIKCVEALLRWKHPVLGMISPVEFVPVAEDTGLISKITEWVLREACGNLASWRQQDIPDFGIAINLSNKHKNITAFIEYAKQVLDEFKLPPESLTFEITESFALEEVEQIKLISDHGIGLSIDDFGTGYSSLSYLSKLSADTLKIDRSFIKNLVGDADGNVLVRSIISLAHGLRMKVVAEGIETDAQHECLQSADCDFLQGYYFSKPLQKDDVVSFMKGHAEKLKKLN